MIKVSENISYSPTVNINTSPERHTTKDWLSTRERNLLNKQKTPLWDNENMPGKSNGGYDQDNRFNDADKTIVETIASYKSDKVIIRKSIKNLSIK